MKPSTPRLSILRASASLLFVLTAILPKHSNAIELTYTYSGLSTLGGSVAWSSTINNAGSIVGSSYRTADRPFHAVRWSGGPPTDLGTLGGSYSSAYSINDSNQVVGSSYTTGDTSNHATLWNGTSKTDLGGIGTPAFGSVAYSVNNAGQIVGVSSFSELGTVYSHATLWQAGTVIDLDTLGGPNSTATAINANGTIVGSASLVLNTAVHATKWVNASPQDLGTLGGRDSLARGLNDAGQVVGQSDAVGGGFRAVLWSGNSLIDLGTLGGTSSTAADINNLGWIVGASNLAGNAASHATLWRGTVAIDMNQLVDSSVGQAGWVMVDAFSINDSGSITGTAVNSLTGIQQAYILTVSSIPEPPIYALIFGGLALVLWLGKRSTYPRGPRLEMPAKFSFQA